MTDRKVKEILRQQPFHVMIRIEKVELLQGHGAISGESYKVTASNGRDYKLRYCNRLKLAKELESNIKKLPHAFPHFYGREGRYLLFEWVKGERITKPLSLDECYKIGKLMGEAHALNDINKNKTVEKLFENMIQELKVSDMFTSTEIKKIKIKFKELRKNLKIDYVLDMHDVHGRNLIKDHSGRIYFVDEEGFTHNIKGLGFAKPLLIGKLIETPEQRSAFWKGYKEHHSNDYFDKDYERFVHFYQLVRSARTRTRTKIGFEENKQQLEKMLK